MAHVFEKKWRSDDVRVQENVDFSALLLSDRVLEGLQKAGFKKPSPIQLEAIPMGKFGKDLLVQAKSGTGKTLVFVVIALEMLKRKLFRPQILIIVPTREIATQVCSVVKAVGSSFHKMTCNSFIGGLPLFEDQEKAVMTQIVVGTPGRLRQLIQLKSLPTNSIRLLIFDEADELLHSTSFKDDLEDIFNCLPDEKQVIATSATFNPKVKKMMYRYFGDPCVIRLNAKQLALLGMVHYAKVVQFCPMPVILYKAKLDILERILKTVKFAQCLMFCNGIQRVEVLYKDVKRWGFSVAYISSAKEQCDRLKAMERLKRFKCKVLVSSDLTARGIDAENVDLVINFDLAYTTEIYMHRVGRAGRYGSIGVAISIIDDKELRYLQRIEKEGSFKAFKLPDPTPKDLILYPPEGEFVIDEQVSRNVDADSEAKKSPKYRNAIWDAFHDDDDLEKEVDAESIHENGVSEANVDENGVSETNVDENGVSETNVDENGVSETNVDENDVSETNVDENGVSETNVDEYNACESELAVDDNVEKEDSEKEINVKNIQVKDTFETCNGVDDNTIKYASSELSVDVKPHDDNANLNEKYEKIDEDVISHSKNKNNKVSKNADTHFNEQMSDKKLQNGCANNNSIKQNKNMHLNLLNDYDQNELQNSKSIDKPPACDIYENSDFCDKNAFEKQGVVNDIIENNTQLIKQFSNMNSNLEKKDFEIDDSKLNKVCTDSMSGSSESKDIVKNLKDNSVNCEPENVSKSCDGLINNTIKTFLDTYESNKVMESAKLKATFDKDSKPEENSGKKLITIDMINDFKSHKDEFFYKAFKKFEESKGGSSASHKKEKGDKEKSNEANTLTELASEEINTVHDKEKSNEGNSLPDIIIEEINTVHEKLAENSEVESEEIFPEEPTFESTPQPSDKKQDTSKITTHEADSKPLILNKLTQLFQELSGESDSDSESNEETSEVVKGTSSLSSESDSLSSDSESSSSSSDSEDESGSETEDSSSVSESNSDSSSSTASSENEHDESVYHHNYSRTGRQNPSLVSGSVRGQVLDDRAYYGTYFQDCRCTSCGGRKKEIPRDNSYYSQVGNPPYFFDHREISSCSRNISQTRSRRGQNFADHSNIQSSLPRKHSRCHRSRKSRKTSRNVTGGGGDQSRNVCPTHRRSSRHHHTLNCFLPTGHRCHPNTADNPCRQGPLCEMWYKTFYNQWLHIQSVIH